jgi:hypothetical protein
MSGLSGSPTEGKKIYLWIAAGLSSGILINIAAWMYWPRLAPLAQPVDRLMLALQCLAGIGFVALSIRMDPQYVYMLPALMTIWCVGRLVFWAGYRYSLNARVIGMDWTTVTTMVTAIWFIKTLF